MTDEPTVDYMGRINLPAPDDESLRVAAVDALDGADEITLPDGGRIFKSSFGDGVFYAPVGEPVGERIETAPVDVKHAVMDEAARVRTANAESERAKYSDPETNPFIKR